MIRTTIKSKLGASLAVILIILPLVIGGFMLLQSRLILEIHETGRQQMRTQARLLAESALARWNVKQGAFQEELGDAGQYTVEEVSDRSFVARGITEREGQTQVWSAICEIPFEQEEAESTPRLLDMRYEFQIRDKNVPSEPTTK